MNILQFFLTFLILAVFGSLSIYGWFICTRGEWIITPDGRWKKTGMIFKYWSLFFEQYRKTKTVHFIEEGLERKLDLLIKTAPLIAKKFKLRGVALQMMDNSISGQEIRQMEDLLLCKVKVVDDMFMLTTEVPVYDWPEWIQKPVSSCLTCMAGPYGTLIWLAFLKLQRGAFLWTDSPISAKIMLGVCFLLTLSCLNTILKKLINV